MYNAALQTHHLSNKTYQGKRVKGKILNLK
jgi:hypothetical protein